MKSICKGDEAVSFGEMPGDFNSIFNSFRPAVGENGHFGEISWRYLTELFGKPHISFVHHYLKAGVSESFGLFLYGRDHLRVAVSNVHHAYTAGEVDKLSTFGIVDDSAGGAFCENWSQTAGTLWYKFVS
jgi:hypothetical protein